MITSIDELFVVSRETHERLHALAAEVEKWNPRVNLIGKSTVSEIYTRHILDSAQFVSAADGPRRWVDLGSGGGFPGLVVSTVLLELAPGCAVHLVESDMRKSAFLRTIIGKLDLSQTTVHAQRIEDVDPLDGDVVSARALAPLIKLLGYVSQHLDPGGTALLSKGQSAEQEISDAQADWSFELERIPSIIQPNSELLKVRKIERRD